MRKFLLCAWMISVMAVAEIKWEQVEVVIPVHPTQIAAEAVFHFTNTGDDPVSISDVVINCGCLSAKPTKPSYAPGEEGTLTIGLNLQGRGGQLRKTVMVRTGDGGEQVLTLVADIPKAYEISSPLVQWNREDSSGGKTIHLHNPNAMPIRLLSITSSHAALPAELKTIRDGFEYEVVVTRRPEVKNARSVIRIATEPPPGLTESKTLKLYAYAR